jgi:hypothetical protein
MNGQMMEDNVDMKQKAEDILAETGYSEQRAAKMSVDDLLKYVTIQLNLLNSNLYSPSSDCYQLSTTSAFTSHDQSVHSEWFEPA